MCCTRGTPMPMYTTLVTGASASGEPAAASAATSRRASTIYANITSCHSMVEQAHCRWLEKDRKTTVEVGERTSFQNKRVCAFGGLPDAGRRSGRLPARDQAAFNA